MPWMGFETMIPVLERAKTIHALDCEATVMGISDMLIPNLDTNTCNHIGVSFLY
jgi:hypothetical protein